MLKMPNDILSLSTLYRGHFPISKENRSGVLKQIQYFVEIMKNEVMMILFAVINSANLNRMREKTSNFAVLRLTKARNPEKESRREDQRKSHS